MNEIILAEFHKMVRRKICIDPYDRFLLMTRFEEFYAHK